MDRRGFLGRVAGAGGAGLVGLAAPTAGLGAIGSLAGCLGGDDRLEDFGDWFADVPNYDGIDDRTGTDRVTVAVGAPEPEGGPYVFDPPAIAVSPGTTVVWEWTGEGGEHDVVEERGAYESPFASTAGFTFEFTFENPRYSRYVCKPHRSLGMKGGVEVRE